MLQGSENVLLTAPAHPFGMPFGTAPLVSMTAIELVAPASESTTTQRNVMTD